MDTPTLELEGVRVFTEVYSSTGGGPGGAFRHARLFAGAFSSLQLGAGCGQGLLGAVEFVLRSACRQTRALPGKGSGAKAVHLTAAPHRLGAHPLGLG